MNEWRDIESAPKTNPVFDGGPNYFGEGVMLFRPGFGQVVAHWSGGCWRTPEQWAPVVGTPTHWMPLPAPPLTTVPAPATQPDTPAK